VLLEKLMVWKDIFVDGFEFSPSSEISELKSSMRNMDKYKYVLNHKIHLLQEEIQPKVCANVLKGGYFLY
jgi:hypothetical protein